MASSRKSPPQPQPVPRLYLATPPLDQTAAIAAELPALILEFDIAAVLVRLAPGDERTLISRIKAIAPAAQKANAAVLIDNLYGIAARSGADGANVAGIEAMREAEPSLKPDRILGVGGLATRHDAMMAGEAGVDYVLFGEPDSNGERPSPEAIFERLQWWAEVFETPCVGYAATLDEAGLFAESGAEFIMVADFIWDDPRGPREALKSAQAAIEEHHARVIGTALAGQG
ncbi:MAG: thiamine phosphate synthase [Xanthobacteraceae bacterium]|nr:thiamine phosphate synthase [Xanthobacteraceae bacterium]